MKKIHSLKSWSFCGCLIAIALHCQGADPLDTWEWRNPLLPPANSLAGIAFINGGFVALGEAGACGAGGTRTRRQADTNRTYAYAEAP